MEKSKLVICDLDGTLFDTRRVNYMAYREAIERAGLPVIFDYDIYVEKCWGPTYRGFLPIMGVPENRFEEIHDAKKLYYEENLKYAAENTHLFNIIKAMKNEYHTAVVTSGSSNSKDILRYFGRLELFDVIFTIDDVKNGKPDPEGFLKAMEKGNILVDFDARTGHNHGTKFRMRQNCLPELYEKVTVIV